MVPEVGIEPTRSHEPRILSPMRLPIPPLGRVFVKMVGPLGLEPRTYGL